MPVKKGGSIIRGNDRARFDSKTRANGECLEWTGALTANGYGKFMTGPSRGQTTWVAHRWAYTQVHGSAPSLLRHKCDNAKCVRVDHLEPGSQLDNVHDALSRGRRHQELTPDLVAEIRSVYQSGQSLRAFAASKGINYSTAYQAATNRSWRHV